MPEKPVPETSLPQKPGAEKPVPQKAVVPKPPSEPGTGRQRLRTALLRPSRAQVVVAVLLAVVGFSAVTQVRANEVDDTYAGLREQDLIDVLNGLAGTTQRAQSEIARLEATRRDLQSSTDARQAALAQAQDRADTLAIMAGLVPVTGPGIRITVTEDRAPVDVDTMLDTIQELRAAGAEAMEFNDRVRVIAQTSVEDTGAGIAIDGEVIDAPYVIDAIGEPTTLAGSLDFATGPVDRVRDEGGTISFATPDEVEIESVVEGGPPRYANPQ